MWADIRSAFSFLTIIPLSFGDGRRPGWSFAWFTLVGAAVGGVLALFAEFAPLTTSVSAFVVLLAWVVLTGGLHLDGFGDSCDGLIATVAPERRLEIMKDPRTGSWAVLGLILLLLGKWTTIPTIAPALLILPPVMGRWTMVMAAYTFPYARQTGTGGYFRDGLGRTQVITATVIALAVMALAARAVAPLLVALAAGLLTLSIVGRWAASRLNGGITGDVYGALCELTELICLLGLSIWANS